MTNNKWLALALVILALVLVYWRLVPEKKKPAPVQAGSAVVQQAAEQSAPPPETRPTEQPGQSQAEAGPLIDPDSKLLWRPIMEIPPPADLELERLRLTGFPIFSQAPFTVSSRPTAGSREEQPEFVLEAIVIEANRRLAVINGAILKEGEEISGARVLTISKGLVTLLYGDQAINLKPGPEKPDELPTGRKN